MYRQSGTTMLELVAVFAIVAILAAVTVPGAVACARRRLLCGGRAPAGARPAFRAGAGPDLGVAGPRRGLAGR